jgi:hypothetical protein
MLTCLATAVVAGSTGAGVALLVGHSYVEKRPHQLELESHTFGFLPPRASLLKATFAAVDVYGMA